MGYYDNLVIPFPVGTRVRIQRQYECEGPEEWLLYEITNISISCNKKGEWTKKYRAMRVIDDKTIDSQRNFNFEEIGKTVEAYYCDNE